METLEDQLDRNQIRAVDSVLDTLTVIGLIHYLNNNFSVFTVIT